MNILLISSFESIGALEEITAVLNRHAVPAATTITTQKNITGELTVSRLVTFQQALSAECKEFAKFKFAGEYYGIKLPDADWCYAIVTQREKKIYLEQFKGNATGIHVAPASRMDFRKRLDPMLSSARREYLLTRFAMYKPLEEDICFTFEELAKLNKLLKTEKKKDFPVEQVAFLAARKPFFPQYGQGVQLEAA